MDQRFSAHALAALVFGATLAGAAPCLRADGGEVDAARRNYMLNCQGCHLPDGAGVPGRVPALKDQVGRFLSVPGGREYLARVPGVAGSSLGDVALADVMNWMLENFSGAQLPPDFLPYTAPEMKALRQQPLLDASGERARLLSLMKELPEVRLRTDPVLAP